MATGAWTAISLDEVCEIVRGGSPRPIMDYITDEPNGLNWLKIGDVSETDKYFIHANEKIKPAGIPKTREVIVGDLILSNSMSFGRPFITRIAGYIHDGWLRLRCNEARLNKDFLYYFLSSNLAQEQFKSVATGSVVNNLKTATVKGTKIYLPPLITQRRIAAVLGVLDEKIETNDRIIANLLEQERLKFEHMLSCCSGSSRMGTIGELGTVVGGGTPPNKHQEYFTKNGIPWITPKDLSRSKAIFISRGERDISQLGYEKSSAKRLPQGTVLFSSRAPIGYIAIASNEVTTNQGFKSIVPHAGFGTPFVFWTLKTNLDNIESYASGSTFREISGSVLRDVPISIPDRALLEQFNAFCEPFFSVQKNLEEQNEVLRNLRDTLLPRLMSCEIDVSNVKLDDLVDEAAVAAAVES
ncbi:MAG: restriction endonuclease subunit S [Clostridia bacterium]|nr:restriction endonuclease subunit S [Clostridia bacterium]